jgi:hypothetical protein
MYRKRSRWTPRHQALLKRAVGYGALRHGTIRIDVSMEIPTKGRQGTGAERKRKAIRLYRCAAPIKD